MTNPPVPGRRALLAMTLGGVAAPALARAGGGEELDLSGYELTFSEEFDRLDVSARGPGTRWTSHTPWGGNFGDAAFVDPRPGFPFSVEDGMLRIEARKGEDGRWRSGLLASVDRQGRGFAQKYGYFEMRARLPRGEGVWPAFWLIGLDRLTPGSRYTAEIDILEHYGNQPERYSSAVAVWDRMDRANRRVAFQRVPAPGGMLYDRFNTFGVRVDAESIRFYFNRREAWRTPTPEQHRQPMFILLNLALGSGWPIDKVPNPSFMFVDHVRVWAPRS